jgi:hypothetical protein
MLPVVPLRSSSPLAVESNPVNNNLAVDHFADSNPLPLGIESDGIGVRHSAKRNKQVWNSPPWCGTSASACGDDKASPCASSGLASCQLDYQTQLFYLPLAWTHLPGEL